MGSPAWPDPFELPPAVPIGAGPHLVRLPEAAPLGDASPAGSCGQDPASPSETCVDPHVEVTGGNPAWSSPWVPLPALPCPWLCWHT